MTLDHGEKSEEILQKICHGIFGEDLCGKSPILHKPSKDIELADHLIWIDDTLVIFQSKSVNIDVSEIDEIRAGRVQKNLDEAKQQLRRTPNAKARSIKTTFINGVGIRTTIKWEKIRKMIGIITLNIRDHRYDDPEMRFSFPLVVDQANEMEIHVFVLRDLFNLVPEMSTPRDALVYLSERSFAARNSIICSNELDFMGFIKSQYPEFEKLKKRDVNGGVAVIEAGYWEVFKENELANRSRAVNYRDSELYDHIISANKTCIEYMVEQHALSSEEATERYLVVLWILSNLARIERREFSRKAMEKYLNTETRKFSYFLSIYEDRNIAFLFVAINEDDREKALAFLAGLASTACHVISVEKLFAIGTLGRKASGGQFDFILMNVMEESKNTPPLDPAKMFKSAKRDHVHEWENI